MLFKLHVVIFYAFHVICIGRMESIQWLVKGAQSTEHEYPLTDGK